MACYGCPFAGHAAQPSTRFGESKPRLGKAVVEIIAVEACKIVAHPFNGRNHKDKGMMPDVITMAEDRQSRNVNKV